MGRPRKAEQLVALSGRIRPEQERWLRWEADRRFEGELSRTLRWAIDQARAFSQLMGSEDPVLDLDMTLNPEKYPRPDDGPDDTERDAERLRRERAIARAYGLEDVP